MSHTIDDYRGHIVKTTLLSLDKINPSDESVYVNSYPDPYSDSDVTQYSADSDASTTAFEHHNLMMHFQEDCEYLITAIVNMIIDIPKNKDQYIKTLSNPSGVHDNININTALCFINPDKYTQLVEILKDPNELNLLTRARKIVVLLQQNILFDSFDEEIIMFHQQLKKLSNQSLINSLSSSLIKSLTIGESKQKSKRKKYKNNPNINIKWLLFIGGTIVVSLILIKYRK
jgi:hypothetical protein